MVRELDFYSKGPGFEHGRREKLRVPGQKIRFGPLVSGVPKSRDEQQKVIASADVRISARNQKITSSRSQAVV